MGFFRGLFRGLLAPYRGIVFVVEQRLWRYLLAPLLLNLALGVGAFWAMAAYWRQEVSPSLTAHPIWAWIGFVGATVLSGIAVFVAVHPLLNAIFSDRLSEKVEIKVRGSAPQTPFLASSARALGHALLKLALYAVALLVGFVLSIPSIGIGALVGIALGGLFLAYDGFDYPLSRRGAGFGAKWAYLALHPGQTLGYGLGATILYLVPLAFLVAPPFAAAGATLAFLDDETKKQKRSTAAAAAAAATAAAASAAPPPAEKGNVR